MKNESAMIVQRELSDVCYNLVVSDVAITVGEVYCSTVRLSRIKTPRN